MPVATGSWGKATIFAPPKMEWICPYGHGTMREHELQFNGREAAAWDANENIWKALQTAGRKKE